MFPKAAKKRTAFPRSKESIAAGIFINPRKPRWWWAFVAHRDTRVKIEKNGLYLLCAKLFVGNLPPEAREKDVRALSDEFGTVRSIDLAHDIFTGKCKGFCFVEMEGHEARAAQAALDGKPLEGGGGFLKVRLENPRRGGRGRK